MNEIFKACNFLKSETIFNPKYSIQYNSAYIFCLLAPNESGISEVQKKMRRRPIFFWILLIPCSVLCDRRERSAEQGACPRLVLVQDDRREDCTRTAAVKRSSLAIAGCCVLLLVTIFFKKSIDPFFHLIFFNPITQSIQTIQSFIQSLLSQ